MATPYDWDGFRDQDIYPVFQEMGQSMTLRRVTHNQDVTDPWNAHPTANETFVDETVLGVVWDVDLKERYESGGLIKRGDRRVAISAKDVTADPDLNDRMLFDGEEWTIAEVLQKVNPAGTTIIYILLVRK